MKNIITLWVGVALFIIGGALPAHAQESCGGIIAPEYWGDLESPLTTTQIIDCSDPFQKSSGVSPYTLIVNSVVVGEGSELLILDGKVTGYEVSGWAPLRSAYSLLFFHDGNNYRFINMNPSVPVEADYRRFAGEYFTDGTDVEPYIAAALDSELRFSMDYDMRDTLYGYLDYVDQHFVPQFPVLTAGTYTLVTHEYELFLTQTNFLQKVFAFIIPTAYAQSVPEPTTYTLTFTVKTAEEPTGASSVLFIPGIMGSRLYEESDMCDSEVGEQERWVSMSECDQMQMAMRVDGVSKNEIYTKAGEAGLVEDVFAAFNLYETFVDALAEWKDDELIADYAVLPYDWRLGLDNILKTRKYSDGHVVYDITTPHTESYLYQTVKDLVENQDGGKVTIVTHSNGGLLAKAFLRTLEVNNDPLLLSIDTIVMVAAPQVGTPDALVGMLHGAEILPIISQETTRQLMANMPFAYHLLPNSNYFSGEGATVEAPVIIFEEGSETNAWISTYGAEIKNKDDMQSFLGKDSGRITPATDDLLTPAVVDGYLFNYANMIETLLGEWIPPATMKVYQVAGVGIDTSSGITYFTDRECVSRNPLKLFQCTEYEPKLGYRPNMVIDGDGTVVVSSALNMSTSTENVERRWVNLRKYNDDGILGTENSNRVHKDILEVDDVINFIKNILEASTTVTYEYLSDTPAPLPSEDRLVFYLHSPLDMSVTTPDGTVSSTTNAIHGATYRRYGELQYISLPRTSGESHTLILNGQSEGSFTLEIEEWGGSEMEERHTYSGIPSSAATVVRMEIQDMAPVADAVLEVDYDGNGTEDIVYNTGGEVVAPVTYGTLKNTINELSLKPAFKKVLLATAKVAEQHHEKSLTKPKHTKLEVVTLQILKQQIVLYVRLRLLSQAEGQNVITIIESLIKK